MPIDSGIYRNVDTQFGLKLADLFNPASIAQRQAAAEEQNMSNQLRQMQVLQGVNQMNRAPVLAQREEQQYQAQQAEALRVQQDRAQKAALFERLKTATPEQRNQVLTEMFPEEAAKAAFKPASVRDANQPFNPDGSPNVAFQNYQRSLKPQTGVDSAATKLAREKFEWEKSQGRGTMGGWKYDSGSDTWVQPPTMQFPQGRSTQSAGKTGAVQNFDALASEMIGNDKTPGLVDKVSSGGTLGVFGKLAPITDKNNSDNFDNIVASMSTEYRKVFRIPGEGALSDKEQAQYGIQLPSRNYNPAVNKAIVLRGQSRINNAMQEGNNPLLTERRQQPSGGGADSEAVAWAQANPNDPRAAKIMSLHGR